MLLRPDVPGPLELPGSGELVGRRYRLIAPGSHSVEPGSWQAFDDVLARSVVVQLFPPGASLAAAEFGAVRAASRLTDARIARIFDADDSGACPYVVCEHAPGAPLDQMLGPDPLDPALAAAITAEAADALAGAHAAGAPHLCLTPRSLRWGETGLKITGLAVAAAAAGVTDTRPGVADTRALGQILYALLTGYWPGPQSTGLPPAPRRRDRLYLPWQVRAGIPAALNDITCRALGLDAAYPDSCFAGPASLAAALHKISAVPVRQRRPRPGLVRVATRALTAPSSVVPRHGAIAAAERAAEGGIRSRLLGDCA